jgi:hypothetical protein
MFHYIFLQDVINFGQFHAVIKGKAEENWIAMEGKLFLARLSFIIQCLRALICSKEFADIFIVRLLHDHNRRPGAERHIKSTASQGVMTQVFALLNDALCHLSGALDL